MKKEFKYPKGHNWEGLTPEQVNEGYKKEFKLIEKRRRFPQSYQGWYSEENIKEFIKLLKEEEDSYDLHSAEAIQFRNAIQKKRKELIGDLK